MLYIFCEQTTTLIAFLILSEQVFLSANFNRSQLRETQRNYKNSDM